MEEKSEKQQPFTPRDKMKKKTIYPGRIFNANDKKFLFQGLSENKSSQNFNLVDGQIS